MFGERFNSVGARISGARSGWLSSISTLAVSAASLAVVLSMGSGVVLAKGGTAKPPPPPPPGAAGACVAQTIVATAVCAPQPPPPAAAVFTNPAFGAAVTQINGFSMTGFLQSATVASCAAGSTAGGTAVINGITVSIPSNLIIQFPANTLTWADAMCPTSGAPGSGSYTVTFAAPPVVGTVVPALGLNGSAGSVGGSTTRYPSIELRIEGNIVGPTHIAALAYASQQSVNSGSGYITSIDYATGAILVGSRLTGPGVFPNAADDRVRLVINDPFGRYGRQQSPDSRFSVDDQNPTIKAGGTGYPMCVPRVAPNPPVGLEPNPVETDPLCPQMNRPRVGSTFGCRNFASIPLIIPRGDIAPDLTATFCSAFVMRAPRETAPLPATQLNPGITGLNKSTSATDPDARQQAPFQVGDFITWSGTLLRGDTAGPAATATISVHTINANVGIFTQPGALPVYIAVGEFGVGVDPIALPKGAVLPAAINGAAQETTARLVLESSVSDITSVVDLYLIDKDPLSGPAPGTIIPDFNRWVTPEEMTGSLTFQVASAIPRTTLPFGGGITTQFDGPQLGRARIRAIKVSSVPCVQLAGGCNITASPTRYMRAVVRGLCAPTSNAAPALFDINGTAPLAAGATPQVNPNSLLVPQALFPVAATPCLQRAQFANGLYTGQYFAPVGNFIFPENVRTGAPIVPYTFWFMDFLRRGEGAGGAAALAPAPY